MRLLAGASDERLVALAHAGDEQAFAAIVERYRAPLLRYCRGFVTSGAAAEDAVQQTFINAYAALSRDDDSRVPAALRPWLYRIAHNAALNVARDPQAGLDELPEGLDGVERPDEVIAARERFRRVIGAVSALPPKQRQVIVRHAVDGDSHERIATDLGMTAGSIRQLAHRARRTVREAAARGGRIELFGDGRQSRDYRWWLAGERQRRAGGAGCDRRAPARRPPLEPRGRRRLPHRGRDELGFVPLTSLREGLRAEYEWVRRRVEAEPEEALRKAG
jgi:RNA polymerase sigma-70 factor (ECF subfamily)